MALSTQPKTATSEILASADILDVSTAVLSRLSPSGLNDARDNPLYVEVESVRVVN